MHGLSTLANGYVYSRRKLLAGVVSFQPSTVMLRCSMVFVCTSLFGLSCYVARAQAKQDTSFPTYRQIKPQKEEIIDYGPRTDFQAKRQKINLFDYPAGSVTYYLNEQPTTDVNYVKQVLSHKSVSVETMSVSAPDKHGKRQIRITYTVEEQR